MSVFFIRRLAAPFALASVAQCAFATPTVTPVTNKIGGTTTSCATHEVGEFNGALLFTQSVAHETFADTHANNVELWRTDGTAAGTKGIKLLGAPTASAYSRSYGGRVAANGVFIPVSYGDTSGLGSMGPSTAFFSDGTVAGTLGSTVSVNSYARLNNRLLLVGYGGFQTTDGTISGTTTYAPFPAGTSDAAIVAQDETRAVVRGFQVNGTQLWLTDGTTAGTRQLTQVGFGLGYSPTDAVIDGDDLYYTSVFDKTVFQAKLSASTWSAAALATTPAFDSVGVYAAQGGKLIFSGTEKGKKAALYLWDGTTNAPLGLPVGISGFRSTPFGSKLLVASTDVNGNAALYINDFTATGSTLVVGGGKALSILKVDGQVAYFSFDDGTNGQELWITDGTKAGTTMLKDVNPGAKGGLDNVRGGGYAGALNGQRFFVGYDGTQCVLETFSGPPTATTTADAGAPDASTKADASSAGTTPDPSVDAGSNAVPSSGCNIGHQPPTQGALLLAGVAGLILALLRRK